MREGERRFLTIEQVAEELSIPLEEVRDKVGEMRPFKFGRALRVERAEMENWVRNQMPTRRGDRQDWPKEPGVYLVQVNGAGGPIKIGYAADIRTRLIHLQTQHPHDVRLLVVLKGGLVEERALHAQFKDFRIGGEWFSCCPALLDLAVRQG